MISEAIVFSYCNQFYAIELQHFITILNSREISLNYEDNVITFCLEGATSKGDLINIKKYLGKDNTRREENEQVILGKINNRFFGFMINKVEEVLSVDSKYIEIIRRNCNEYVRGVFSFDGNDYTVLDIKKIVEESVGKINYSQVTKK